MRHRFILPATFIILLVLSLQSIYAFEIKPARQSYLVGETFQATVEGNFSKSLEEKNIYFFVDGIGIGLPFHLEKISSGQYFIYVDLPSQGSYTLEVKNALYIEEGMLKGDAKRINFEVLLPLATFYSSVKNSVAYWTPLTVEEHAYALLALSYDTTLKQKGINTLIDKSKNKLSECWSSSCNVKDTALAIYALTKLNKNVTKRWFLDSQNNLDIGIWDLIIDSAGECTLNISNTLQKINLSSGNVMNLNLKSKPEKVKIELNCSENINGAKISHTYLGLINEFPLTINNKLASLTLSNEKCFGKYYRTECDGDSTAYTLFALDVLGIDKKQALEWLKKNAVTTKQKAIANYFDSGEMRDWLENNQHENGYWSTKGLAESTQSNFEATVFATLSLSGDVKEKGKKWLRKNVPQTLKEKSLLLAFIFQYADVENVISINPSFFKAPSLNNIEFEIKNKGLADVNVSMQLEEIKKEVKIASGGTAKVIFTLPTTTQIKLSFIEVAYPEKILSGNFASYSIPVIILPKGVNATNITDVNVTLVAKLNFSEASINKTLLIGIENLIKISLKNPSSVDAKNISITFSRDFYKILNVTPNFILLLKAGKSIELNLTFTPLKEAEYDGFIEAKTETDEIAVKIPVLIKGTKNESLVPPTSEKSCSELRGKICKQNESCSVSIIFTNETVTDCGEKTLQAALSYEKTEVPQKEEVDFVLTVLSEMGFSVEGISTINQLMSKLESDGKKIINLDMLEKGDIIVQKGFIEDSPSKIMFFKEAKTVKSGNGTAKQFIGIFGTGDRERYATGEEIQAVYRIMKCSGAIAVTKTVQCCTGQCTEKKPAQKGGIGKFIIISLLLIILFGIIIFFGRRLRKPKKEMKDIVSKIEEKYMPKAQIPTEKR